MRRYPPMRREGNVTWVMRASPTEGPDLNQTGAQQEKAIDHAVALAITAPARWKHPRWPGTKHTFAIPISSIALEDGRSLTPRLVMQSVQRIFMKMGIMPECYHARLVDGNKELHMEVAPVLHTLIAPKLGALRAQVLGYQTVPSR